MPIQDDIYRIADELRATASHGLYYAKAPEVQERYQRVLNASARLVGILDQRPHQDVRAEYERVLLRFVPLLTASAAIFREDRILVVRRGDTGLWSLPRDVVGLDEMISEAAQRVLSDQAGIEGRARKLIGIFDSRSWPYPAKSHFYQAVYHVEPVSVGGPSSTGTTRFVTQDDLANLSLEFDPVVSKAFDLHHRQVVEPYFDLAGDLPSRGTTLEAALSQRPVFFEEVLEISSEIAEVGSVGIGALEHPYTLEIYERFVSTGARLAEAAKTWSTDETIVLTEDNIGLEGLRLGAFAAAFRDGDILLIRRDDTGRWALPAGMVEVGESWADAAVREMEEETSVPGQVKELLALFDMRVLRDPNNPLAMACFLVEPDPAVEPKEMPETLGSGYFPMDDLPDMSPTSTVHVAIDLYQGRVAKPHVDFPEKLLMRHSP